MAFSITKVNGCAIGMPPVKVYNAKGELKVCVPPSPPPASVVWGSITGIVTNQTDLITYLGLNFYPLSSNPAGYLTQTAADLLYYPLTSNPAGYITAAALAGYVPTTRTLTINGTSYDLSADRSWTIPAGGTVTSVELAAGTGISLSGTNPITTSGTITVTNSAPDQVVALTGGTGISTSGTYPNFTITNTLPDQTVVLTAGTAIGITGAYPSFTINNTAPDQVVTLTAGTGIGIAGTYPSFTISNSSPASGVTLTSAGGTETLVNDGTGPSLATKGLTAGTGVSLSSNATAVTITNSAPDQTVSLATTGTGLSVTGTYPSFTLQNTLPDQTVVLSGGTGISISGTYPSFTIDNTAPGTTYTVDNGLTENPAGNFQLGGGLLGDTNIDGGASGTWMLDFTNLHSSTNTARYLYSFATGHAGNNTLLSLDSNSNVSRFSHEDGGTGDISAIELTGKELRVQTPAYATATNGDVLTLLDNTTGAAEWQTPTGGGGGILHGTASGTDTYTVTITGVTAYADGDAYLIRFTNGNTTGATLNINGLGAVTLYRNNDGALIGGDIVNGAEMLCIYNSTTSGFQVIGTAPNTLLGYVTNGESITITKGQAVYAFSGTGDRMVVKLANNTGDPTSAQTVGLVLSTSIAANQKGLIMMQGLLDGLNILPTSTYNDGDPIFLGPTAGSITKTKPYAPNHLVYLGVVTTASNGNAGRMYVKVQNGYELDELHNVQAQTPAVNDVLYFFGGSPGQWKTASISTILGYTPQAQLNGTGFVKASGTTISYDNTTYAPLASPAFTGTPTAPTASSGTNTTQIATTAFVQTAVEQSSSLVGVFGDGGSGNATITGPLSLSNDAYYNDLTISGAGSIFLNGFRLFVRGTLDISNAGANAIYNNGFAGDGATGVTAGNNTGGGTLGRGGYGQTTSGWHSGGTGSNVPYRGGNGGGGATLNTNNAGVGVQAPASTLAVSGGSGGTGGKGGNSTIGAGGNGGAGQTTSASPTIIYVRTFLPDVTRIQTVRQSTAATTTTVTSAAGAYHGGGGGGGGSSATNNGGGGSAGGGGGGNTIIYARQIVVGAGTNASAIAARGGDGGNSTYTPTANIGGGGGGAGGGGGYIYLVYGTITGGTYTFASANGGTGGNGGNGNGTGVGGQGGQGGSGGRITAISLGYNTITVVDGTGNLGTTPAIPTTPTGSAGGAGGTCTFSS